MTIIRYEQIKRSPKTIFGCINSTLTVIDYHYNEIVMIINYLIRPISNYYAHYHGWGYCKRLHCCGQQNDFTYLSHSRRLTQLYNSLEIYQDHLSLWHNSWNLNIYSNVTTKRRDTKRQVTIAPDHVSFICCT